MKKNKIVATVIASVVAVLIILFALFGLCIPINIHCEGLWAFTVVACFAFVLTRRLILGFRDFGRVTVIKKTGSKGRTKKHTEFRFSLKPYIVPLVLLGLYIAVGVIGVTFFNATSYASILTVT